MCTRLTRRVCVVCVLGYEQERTEEILRQGKGYKHVMNLGHGIEAVTPEENAKFFIDTVKNFRYD